ncbi:hypothetical protein [Cylindrospermopsis raciborskii]|uniref:hypothetical protein n=1 Tax=Cylindrospermopsis raciborskii TaxID=77022 RepID=UPI0038798ED2
MSTQKVVLKPTFRESGEEISTVKCAEDAIYTITFSPNGKLLATGSGDKTITVFPYNYPET